MQDIPIRKFKKLPEFNFTKLNKFSFTFSILLVFASIISLATKGLNKGIDFTGGILIEAHFKNSPSLANLRNLLSKEDLGEVSLQEFGSAENILIRIGNDQKSEKKQIAKIKIVKNLLNHNYPEQINYRKTDYVGPTVGKELITSGISALIIAFLAMMIYIWIRFDFKFGIGALIALIHDTILTMGFFAITQLEFNLTSIAAILTIIGYSINDSVVIYDRIRENIRKYRKKPMPEIIDQSVNETLTRTLLTAGTTIIALLALAIFGGNVLQSFSLAVLFGVVIGTYSSIYIAAPILNSKKKPKII
jgi:preprotein translocase subunit SecF